MSAVEVKFLDYFTKLEDPRIDRKKLYPMGEILLVTACGIICGAEGWHDFWLFGKQKLDYLRTVLPFKNGIPTDDTFRRFYITLDPEEFKSCFVEWVKALQQSSPKFVAIDGKTSRRSHDKRNGTKAMHTVSAWASEQGIVLGQCKTEEKSNEITAIPELLKLLSVENATVTIDAMGCQREIAETIIQKNANYILAVKDNQKLLNEEVTRFFTRHKKLNYIGRGYEFKHFEETDKGHGRIEIRKCTVVGEVSWMSQESKWKNLKTLAMIESTRIINDQTTTETRYYISSLQADPINIAKAIRSHWGIENSLHWVLDVSFNEDRSRIRKGHAPQNIGIIRHVALNMLNSAKSLFKGASIKSLRKACGWNDNALSAVLNANF